MTPPKSYLWFVRTASTLSFVRMSKLHPESRKQLGSKSATLETGLTTYDASYLYLARSLGVPLLTFDGRLAAKTK